MKPTHTFNSSLESGKKPAVKILTFFSSLVLNGPRHSDRNKFWWSGKENHLNLGNYSTRQKSSDCNELMERQMATRKYSNEPRLRTIQCGHSKQKRNFQMRKEVATWFPFLYFSPFIISFHWTSSPIPNKHTHTNPYTWKQNKKPRTKKFTKKKLF